MRFRYLALVALGLLTAAFVQGQDTKKEDDLEKDKALLEGAWTAVSMEREGEKAPEDFVKEFKLVFNMKKKDSADKDTVTGRHRAEYKIDPSLKPKTIDVTATEGPDKDRTIEGIYELKGDELKVCIALPGKERPTEFVSKPGSGTVLLVLKKEKAEK